MGEGSGGDRLGRRWAAAVVGLAALGLLPGLGGSTRLSYHEAIVAQGAREMIAAGAWLVPTLDGRPWLEKPPLLHWLVAVAATIAGGVTELAARLPSALAAAGLALAVATLAARRLGPAVGGLAGCVQATVAWSVVRGRLAESDILLACLVAWTMVALDRLRLGDRDGGGPSRLARRFLIGLGATALAKGIGFGAALVLAASATVLLWDRDRRTARCLLDPLGLAVGTIVGLAWPALILLRFPAALGLWTAHVADRLADRPEVFAGRASWWAYLPAVLGLTLPWTPLALMGARRSLGRAVRDRGGLDRLLWAWAVAPMVLLSMASVKNAHYAIHALPPWSIWAALGLARLGETLAGRGRSGPAIRRRLAVAFVGVAAAFGVGSWVVGSRFDRRGVEWAFYEAAARRVDPGEPVVLLYDDWDRLPYPSPFGPVPHDLAVRLYYLDRPALWRQGVGAWPDLPARPFVAIARARDLDGLRRVGRVEAIAQGPPARWDRTYAAYRVVPEASGAEAVAAVDPVRGRD